MIDDIFKDSNNFPAMVNGMIYLNDKEINFIMGSYASLGTGYDYKRKKTVGYHRVHRKTLGLKLWEDMSLEERKKEFFSYLRLDLELAWQQLDKRSKVDYLLDRALDPMDPMNNSYKMVLVKLGAKITDDGKIKLTSDLVERLENWELRNKRLIDLVPIKELEQGRKLEPKETIPALRLKPNFSNDL